MPHDDSRTTGRSLALARRLAAARRAFCRHVRSALGAQACAIRFEGASPAAFGDGIAAAQARTLGALDAETTGRLGFAQALEGRFGVGGGVLRIAVLRRAGEPAFTAADAAALNGIGALAVPILDLVGTATEQATLWQGSMQALDRLALGVVLVGADGEVLASNRTARDIALSHGRGNGTGPPGRLLHTLSQTVRRGNGHTADAAAAFARLEDGESGPISVLATPLARPNGERPARQASTALFLSDSGRLFAPYQNWLCRFYGLTRLEAQLVTQIVEGRSLNDIAAALHVSIHTVRSYLKQIFGKTGVKRQAGLVKLLLGGIGQVRADHDAAPPAPGSFELQRCGGRS